MIDNYEEFEDYMLVPVDDYRKLVQISKLREKGSVFMLDQNDVLFISSVIQELHAKDCEIKIEEDDQITIEFSFDYYSYISKSFTLSDCKEYYNKASRFIKEKLLCE